MYMHDMLTGVEVREKLKCIGCGTNYLMDLQQKFSEVGVYFHYISCCGFTRF